MSVYYRTNVLAIIAALNLLVTLVLEGDPFTQAKEKGYIRILNLDSSVWSIVLIYQRWTAFRSEDLKGDNLRRLRSAFELELPLRIMGFGLYIVISMRQVTAGLFWFDYHLSEYNP